MLAFKSYYGLYSVKDDKSVCFSENGEAMTNDGLSLQIHVPFFFIVKNRTKKCPAAAHGKKPGKIGKVYLTLKAQNIHCAQLP